MEWANLILLQCCRLFCELTNHHPLDIFYIIFEYLQIPRTHVSNAGEARPNEELMLFIRLRCMLTVIP